MVFGFWLQLGCPTWAAESQILEVPRQLSRDSTGVCQILGVIRANFSV